jgi:hypothetical protein
MKLFDKILVSSDEGEMFLPFLPYVSMVWKKLFGVEVVLALLSDRKEDDPFVENLRKYAEVVLVKPVKGVPTITSAKLAKHQAVQKYPNDIIMFNDLDLIPLNAGEYNKELVKREKGKILFFGYNLYNGDLEGGKSLVGGTTAEGYIWKEILNPNNLSFDKLLYSYNNLDNYELDKTNKITNDWFGEETAMRSLIHNWGREDLIVRVPWFDGNNSDRLLDRADWKLSEEKLYKGYYIYAHMLRPFNQYKEELYPLFKYVENL